VLPGRGKAVLLGKGRAVTPRGEGRRFLASWWRARRLTRVEQSFDTRQREIESADDFLARDASDTETSRGEPGVAILVESDARGLCVVRSVDFDDQSRGEADEVDDIRSKWHLTSELGAIKTLGAQLTPNKLLDRGLTVPQRLCQGALGRGDLVSRHVSPRGRFHHSAMSATEASGWGGFPLPLWERVAHAQHEPGGGVRRRDERRALLPLSRPHFVRAPSPARGEGGRCRGRGRAVLPGRGKAVLLGKGRAVTPRGEGRRFLASWWRARRLTRSSRQTSSSIVV
jgi:hypothetical protein